MRRSIAFLCIGFLVVALLIGAYAELGLALLVAIVFIGIAAAAACRSLDSDSFVQPALIALISSHHLARASLPAHS